MLEMNIFKLLIIAVLILALLLIGKHLYQQRLIRKQMEQLKGSGMLDIDRMTNFEFETFVKLVFEKVGFTSREVEDDEKGFGADFLLDGDTKAVLQVLRSGSNTRIGLKAVQEIYTAKNYFQTEEAWIIANTIFSDKAKKVAEVLNVKLIDRFLLQELILTVNPEVSAKEVRESLQQLFYENSWEYVKFKQNNPHVSQSTKYEDME